MAVSKALDPLSTGAGHDGLRRLVASSLPRALPALPRPHRARVLRTLRARFCAHCDALPQVRLGIPGRPLPADQKPMAHRRARRSVRVCTAALPATARAQVQWCTHAWSRARAVARRRARPLRSARRRIDRRAAARQAPPRARLQSSRRNRAHGRRRAQHPVQSRRGSTPQSNDGAEHAGRRGARRKRRARFCGGPSLRRPPARRRRRRHHDRRNR